jgi:hypothetical protein
MVHRSITPPALRIHLRPAESDAPIVTDPATLRELPRSAYVLLRPTGDLVDAFERWQGEVLDRLALPGIKLAAAHASMKSFGTSDAIKKSESEALTERLKRARDPTSSQSRYRHPKPNLVDDAPRRSCV